MNNTIQLHIVLSTVTFAVLVLAALLAGLSALQDYGLRHQRSILLCPRLPLTRTESWLFKILVLGFILLTLDMVTGFWFFYRLLTPFLWHKTFLAVFSWIIFLILLVGRYYAGWRGRLAIRWTLLGVFLVMMAYIGSLVW